MQNTTRYSDEELALFKIHIELKLETAREDYQFISSQIEDVTASMEEENDPMDDSSNNMDLERLQIMAVRHQHHIRDLENALLRVRNKSFGICSVTNELIDKRRLMAVPATTKSLAAKNAVPQPEKKVAKPSITKSASPKIITKVISKKVTPVSPVILEEEEDIFLDDFYDEDNQSVEDSSGIDFDSIPAEEEED